MNTRQLLLSQFASIRDVTRAAVQGLGAAELAFRPGGSGNSIGWLVWHLTRVQDDHVAEIADRPQVWVAEGFVGRFALPFVESATGFGQRPEEVDAVKVDSPDLLVAYHDAVSNATTEYLTSVDERDFDRIIDDSWDPPVTVGVRLCSVIGDDFQHAGQAAFVRGLLR